MSSKTTRTAAGGRATTEPFAGPVRTRVACAQAAEGTARAARIAMARRQVTSGGIAVLIATVALVLFKQFVDDDLGCASYLVGDEHAGVAVLVDPAYAVEQYLDECKR